MARRVLVNSEFTKGVFFNAFPTLTTEPNVLYPCIKEDSFKLPKDFDSKSVIHTLLNIPKDQPLPNIITSLNRYERKKNIGLAIRSFRSFMHYEKVNSDDYMLVIAGGYDDAVTENVEHYEQLVQLASGLTNVRFLKSISNEDRLTLLEYTDVLTYTPENEHFGIVPVEAMYMNCIVLACNSGGPTESIVDGETGYLLEGDDVGLWGQKLDEIYNSKSDTQLLNKLKQQGKQRVEDIFSFDAFANQLSEYVYV
jgi:alpha-1,3/alpha-1,6-mannosyltransferase